MKKADMKRQMETYSDGIKGTLPPQVYKIIKCKDKEYSTSGCTSCWACISCGRSGCDNIYWARLEDKIVKEECNLED